MKVINKPSEMSGFSLRARRKGRRIGLVPTMGYLHRGHSSLIKRAKKENDAVVVSIFVNPAQFGPRDDFRVYPRDFKRDSSLCRKHGVDVIFHPSTRYMYSRDHLTYVNVKRITETLCGSSRPGHFKGVATVVAKLFNIVMPDAAYFGQKDAQQALVIKKMVRDLNFDLKVKILPIVRERSGLAVSSRNEYLSDSEKDDARVLYLSLKRAKDMIAAGERDLSGIKAAMKKIINSKKSARIDYVEIVDPGKLTPLGKIEGGALAAVAVYINGTRLIDNMTL
jgi:pantoate--beta-alanine ligase